jgi:hypothetical protein
MPPLPRTRYGKYNWNEWEEATMSRHVRISDILKLKPNETAYYICLDRNVWDIALAGLAEDSAHYDALWFFRGNIVKFTKTGNSNGISGTLDFPEAGLLDDFELHLEYRPENWFPLKDGEIPAKDDQGFAEFPWTEAQPWHSFPASSTRVGYRGPFVKIDRPLPRIIY